MLNSQSKIIKNPNNGFSRTSQACDRCRIKKTKCDGLLPNCTNCTKIGFQCRTSDRLSRRSFPKGYTEYLEQRLIDLQGENEALTSMVSNHQTPLAVKSVYPTYTFDDALIGKNLGNYHIADYVNSVFDTVTTESVKFHTSNMEDVPNTVDRLLFKLFLTITQPNTLVVNQKNLQVLDTYVSNFFEQINEKFLKIIDKDEFSSCYDKFKRQLNYITLQYNTNLYDRMSIDETSVEFKVQLLFVLYLGNVNYSVLLYNNTNKYFKLNYNFVVLENIVEQLPYSKSNTFLEVHILFFYICLNRNGKTAGKLVDNLTANSARILKVANRSNEYLYRYLNNDKIVAYNSDFLTSYISNLNQDQSETHGQSSYYWAFYVLNSILGIRTGVYDFFTNCPTPEDLVPSENGVVEFFKILSETILKDPEKELLLLNPETLLELQDKLSTKLKSMGMQYEVGELPFADNILAIQINMIYYYVQLFVNFKMFMEDDSKNQMMAAAEQFLTYLILLDTLTNEIKIKPRKSEGEIQIKSIEQEFIDSIDEKNFSLIFKSINSIIDSKTKRQNSNSSFKNGLNVVPLNIFTHTLTLMTMVMKQNPKLVVNSLIVLVKNYDLDLVVFRNWLNNIEMEIIAGDLSKDCHRMDSFQSISMSPTSSINSMYSNNVRPRVDSVLDYETPYFDNSPELTMSSLFNWNKVGASGTSLTKVASNTNAGDDIHSLVESIIYPSGVKQEASIESHNTLTVE